MKENGLTYTSRFIVPFYYDSNDIAGLKESFLNEELFLSMNFPKDGKFIEKGFWENYRSDTDSLPEMDLYSYMPNLYYVPDGKHSNIGYSIVYRSNGAILKIEYDNSDFDRKIPITCDDMGVILYKNGVGLLWYELSYSKIDNIEKYLIVQNDLKELIRSNTKTKIKVGFDSNKKEPLYEQFIFAKWIEKLLKCTGITIHFWAERYVKENNEIYAYPDKAILFQYLFVEDDKEKIYEIAYRLANGYDMKYNVPSMAEDDVFKPFGNGAIYASSSGTSYVVCNKNTNDIFFKSGFSRKYQRDYFFIYTLLLYQSYSCSLYSRRLMDIPAEIEKLEIKNKETILLEITKNEIDLFLVKSVFEFVSNVDHQNGYYAYVRNRLKILENIQSLTVGLNAVNSMVREKEENIKAAREERLNKGLFFFGLLVAASTLIDGFNLVDWFMVNNMTWGHASFLVIVLLFVFILILLFLTKPRDKR